MVAATDSAGHRCSSRNGGRLSEGGRNRPAAARRLGTASPAKPANEVITDSAPAKPANEVSADPVPAKPANEVTTDFGAELAAGAAAAPEPQPGRSPSASACEPYREAIELGLSHGRNAMAIWQDLVDTCGFAGGYQSVKRFVRKLRGKPVAGSLRGHRDRAR